MKLLVMTLFDAAAEVYLRPFFVTARGEGIRMFSDLVADAEHPCGRHPEHYTLFVVGEYDQSKGELLPMTPVALGNGLEYRARGSGAARLEA